MHPTTIPAPHVPARSISPLGFALLGRGGIPRAAKVPVIDVYTTCRHCDRAFTLAQWDGLPSVEHHVIGIDKRICRCGGIHSEWR